MATFVGDRDMITGEAMREDCEARLRSHRWLSGMGEDMRSRILAAGRTVALKPGDQIVMAGSEEGGMFGFASGCISSRQSMASPDLLMTDMHLAPFWLISRTILPGEQWVTTLTAQSPVVLLRIPRAAMVQMLVEHPELNIHILRNISAIFSRMTVALSDALIRRPDQRCAAVMLRIIEQRFEGDTPVEIPAGQTELAGMANLSRQKVNEVLRAMEDAGLVETGYRRIRVLAPAPLRAMLEV